MVIIVVVVLQQIFIIIRWITLKSTNTAASGTMYCMYPYYASTMNLNDNTISNIQCGQTIYGDYNYNYYVTGTSNIYNNTWTNLTVNATAGTIYGLYLYYSSGVQNTYKNRITGLTASGATTCATYGIYMTNFSGAAANPDKRVYNNYIGNFTTASSTSGTGQVGMYFPSGTAYVAKGL